jgi:hypothetical protein
MAFTRASPEMELAESSEVSNFESSSIHKQPTDRIKYDNWNQVVSMKEELVPLRSPLKIFCRLYHFGKQGNSLFSYGY